jgi:hypothetical protein
LVVLQRARSVFFYPFGNALLCTLARHFTTLPKIRQQDSTLRFSPVQEVFINEEAVLDYHKCCIANLRLSASEPDAMMDENILVALVVLCFYEELDGTPTFRFN